LQNGGGDPLLRKVESRLGNVPALYAPLDVPYTLYEIYKGNKKVGYIHGVNQKGQFGVLEVFVSLDMDGMIKSFYIQRIAGQLRTQIVDGDEQYVGTCRIGAERCAANGQRCGKGSGKVAAIVNPAPETVTDFFGLLRAVKKNLILMDEFFYSVEKVKG